MTAARIAVVGCGWWSTEAHLPALAAHPRAEAIAVVEPDPRRREIAVERFGVAHAFAGLDELLDAVELDGAIVGTAPRLHHPLAGRLLDAGIHTLVEKPMTVNPGEAHDLVARAERQGVQLLVGYPWHYNAHVASVRAEVESGRIGELELVSSTFASVARELYHGRPESYARTLGYTHMIPGADTYNDQRAGGQGASQLTHAAALMLWLTGLEVSEVSAFTANFELDVDLADSVAIRFGSGALGSLASAGNVLAHHQELLEYRLLGSEGHVLLDVGGGTASIHDSAGVELLEPLPEAERYPTAGPVGDLVAATEGATRSRVPGPLGAHVVELLAAMHRSQDERRSISLTS